MSGPLFTLPKCRCRATIARVSSGEAIFGSSSLSDPLDLIARFERRLTETERIVVTVAREWSVEHGALLYCVGGSVRDLLLGRAHLDLDLAVEGDVAALAKVIAERTLATVTFHPSFGTAVMTGDGWAVDLIRTRSESYAHPAALPEVEPAPITADLARRDFSVHAMALPLSGPEVGVLLDPFGGIDDLRNRELRVLHRDSFRDDPTRILRLARYAARLGFAISSETGQLARRDSTFLSATSPARTTHELERIFREPQPELSLLALRELRALTAISPHFRVLDSLTAQFELLRSDGGPRPGTSEYLATTAALWDRPAIQGLADSLELRADTITALRELPRAVEAVGSFTVGKPDPALVVRQLDSLPLPPVRGAAAALGGVAARIVRRYLNQWRSLRPVLRGTDLIELGVPAGPQIGRLLEHLRTARLRSEACSRGEEIALVKEWLDTNGLKN